MQVPQEPQCGKNMKNSGLSLLEVIVVLVVIGLIATLGLINYAGIKEEALDKEARANLKLIQAAEKIYHMEFNPNYFPPAGVETDLTQINDNLNLAIPSGVDRKWNYGVDSTGTSTATRVGGGGRSWTLDINADDPICTGCP